MLSAFRGVRAVSLLFLLFVFATPAFPQSLEILWHIADPPITTVTPGGPPCLRVPEDPESALYKASIATSGPAIPCDATPITVSSPFKDAHPMNYNAPLRLAKTVLPPKYSPVDPRRDLFRANLAAMGKPGQLILRARDRALEILDAPNACSAWFQEKDPDPAATFRTLTFDLDQNGPDAVLESFTADALHIFRQPYVAIVTQDSGAYAAIKINAQGAFFRSAARVVETRGDVGPVGVNEFHYLTVGYYTGGTLSAQVLTLLHEFGHVLDLLPVDLHDVGGKSVQNTSVVLSHCRSAIEAKPVRNASIKVARNALQGH